jgi:anti-anti-sigma regulatory factor
MKTFEMKNGATKIIKMSDLIGKQEIAELKKEFINEHLYDELIIDFTDVSYLDQHVLDLLIN